MKWVFHEFCRQALARWIEYTEEKQELKEMTKNCVKRMIHWKISIAFCHWKDVVDYSLLLKQRAMECLSKLQNRELSKAFNSWREYSDWRIYAKQVVLLVWTSQKGVVADNSRMYCQVKEQKLVFRLGAMGGFRRVWEK